MYSLVSASVLCMDLVRHDNATGVIDVLDRALTLGPDDVPLLGSVHCADAARDEAWAEVERVCGHAPRLSEAVSALHLSVRDGGLGALAGGGFADRLSRTPMFGLPHLLSMVRTDVLDWTWDSAGSGNAAVRVQRHPAAVSVVADAVAAAYAREQLSVASYARLGEPWSRLHRGVPTALPVHDELGPQSAPLRELVDTLARLGPEDFAGLATAAAAARAGGLSWSATMHNATWAAYVSGRLRTAARAQLAASRALVIAGVSPLAAACGVMRVVTAAVQALVVADLLDGPTYDELTAPWRFARGLA